MRRIFLWSIAAGATLAACYVGFKTVKTSQHPLSPVSASADSAESDRKDVVELSQEKFTQSELRTVTVQRKPLQHLHTVPGKIEYNGLQRVDLKAPLDSTIQQVLVKPGDVVVAGTRLAVLDSPDIGLVRADVEKHRAELQMAVQSDEWAGQIADNTRELLEFLKGHPTTAEVEKRFENKPLGDRRQQLFASYARYVLAENLWHGSKSMVASGSISSQTAQQRESNREVTKAEYQAIREQTGFECQQQRAKSRAAREYALQMFVVSQQRLKTMLGTFSEVRDSEPSNKLDPQPFTRYFLIAPIAGTIEERTATAGQRVSSGQSLFVVANTSSLWVTAELREHDWPALQLIEGIQLKVRVPALEGKEIAANVNFVGRSVSTDTQAVPLVATVENSERMLKPGMFVWVILPIGAPTEQLAIPQQAILTHDKRRFVFVEESPRRFRRQEIETGIDSADWIAVTSGLKAGDKVVDRGTFLLKSELLLEPEE